jgi:hypothetical protein
LKWHLQNTFRVEKLTNPPSGNELISRIINDTDHIFKATGGVKPAAFTPHKTRNDISTYRTSNCEDEKIWWIAETFIDKKRKDNKISIGRAEFQLSVVTSLNIHINPDGKPHLRHTNLEQFAPRGSSELQLQKLELANASTFHKKP